MRLRPNLLIISVPSAVSSQWGQQVVSPVKEKRYEGNLAFVLAVEEFVTN
jgi:hypothetical protein